MTIERKLLGTVDATATEAVYIEDVMATYLYTGTGASQTITNGIDLATKGGMVWIKERNGTNYHCLMDTSRGVSQAFFSNTTSASSSWSLLTAANANGFTASGDPFVNTSGNTYTSWTFRKQAKFFDVVTYTGTGSARTISHALGATPGMIIVKRTDTTGNWQVYHRSLTSAANSIQLNLTAAQASATTVWNSTAPTSSVFSVGTDATVNASGGTYVAYLFADSDSGGFGAAGTDSVVACGSFTTNGSGDATVSLGWEPQLILIKPSSTTGNWKLIDNMRGLAVTSNSILNANLTNAETSVLYAVPTATGFTYNEAATQTYIYLAIRRGPMKTPTDATKVFHVATQSSDTTTTTGFPVDFVMNLIRNGGSQSSFPRLTNEYFEFSTQAASAGTSYADFKSNTSIKFSGIFGATPVVIQSFRRAPGFFDVVCYTGTGANRTVAHNLGVAPEFMVIKRRPGLDSWVVYHKDLGNTKVALMNSTSAATASLSPFVWNDTSPTSSVFTVGTEGAVNGNNSTFVAYLFATCPGVSKIGSYTGTGTTKQIDCGFASGARFVLIKRTDSTGSWYVWDTARGLVSGNDPYLLLNSSAAEVTTTDYIDPYSAGFEISSTAPAEINASGGTYIYLAIA